MKLSSLNEAEFVKAVQDLDKRASDPVEKWRKEAKKDFAFYVGEQWEYDDLKTLEEQGRPAVTFNRVAKVIDSVSGNEVVNRQEIRYIPRTIDDAAQTEVYNELRRWVDDQTDAEDEVSDAFRDCLICGMGWTDTCLNYEEDPDGRIDRKRIDPLEMKWDVTATERNLTDAQWVIRERWVRKDAITAQWPGKEPSTEQRDIDQNDPHDADAEPYTQNQKSYNAKTKEYRVLEVQWFELETYHRGVDPETGDVKEVTEEEAKYMKAIKQKRRKYYRGFIAGNTFLGKSESPVNAITYKCITGKRDRKEGYSLWYGIMRGLRDPQLWANKFFSQILHIYNSTPKGATYYETGALTNPEKAREDINSPTAMVELNPGGLNKIRHEASFNIPANLDRMLQYAIQAIPDVSGVNPEFTGNPDRDQPGIVEFQRARQALGILSIMFDSLRRYRKLQGRMLLEFMHKYIPDGRMFRIVGAEGEQFIQYIKPENPQYDVIVDESPTSPNSKTEAWAAISQLLPVLQSSGFPVIPEVIDFMPLPKTITEKWKQAHQQQTEAMTQLQEELQKTKEENLELKVKREERVAANETKQVKEVLTDQREKAVIDIKRFEAMTDRLEAILKGASNGSE